jgi:hypothetical protein
MLFSASLILVIASQGLGFGGQGHRAIGKTAEGGLNAKGRAGVTKVLGSIDLASIATWPDDVKLAARGKGPLVNDPEANTFNHAFPKNGLWHFVNLPLGMPAYLDDGPFSESTDIVHAINGCIRILETTGPTPKFSKLQALRFLVHLVGDLHQPLHVGTGYYTFDVSDKAILITDPDAAQGKTHDVGGNDLYFSSQGELHALWDTGLVEQVSGTTDFQQLATFLLAKINDPNWVKAHPADWKTPGNYHVWAEQWATDSVRGANEVYSGITFGEATFDTHQRLERIEIKLSAKYKKDHLDRETVQLALAGVHLAQLLNTINWK